MAQFQLEPSISNLQERYSHATVPENDAAYGKGMDNETARSWEGIESSHGNNILGIAGQDHGVAFSAAPTIGR